MLDRRAEPNTEFHEPVPFCRSDLDLLGELITENPILGLEMLDHLDEFLLGQRVRLQPLAQITQFRRQLREHYRHLGRKDALRRMEQIVFVNLDGNEQERSGEKELPAQNTGVCDGAGQ